MKKAEVREIAHEQGLITADKKDSQGLCFVGKISLPDFLQQQLQPKEGKIIEIPASNIAPKDKLGDLDLNTTSFHFEESMGEVVGNHHGAHYFTIGQRKGLSVGGKEKPLFVIGTDVKSNLVYTGQGQQHPGLYRKGLRVAENDIHWIREDLNMAPGEKRTYQVRIRYRQPLVNAELHYQKGKLYVIFEEAQRGVAAGQFVAWYDGEELIGSGVIA